MFKENTALTSILAFDDINTKYYSNKFKLKQQLTELINTLTEYRIMAVPKLINRQYSKAMDIEMYELAKAECIKKVFFNLNIFEEQLAVYSNCVEKIRKIKQIVEPLRRPLQNQILELDKQILENVNAKSLTRRKQYRLCFLQLFELCNFYQQIPILVQSVSKQFIEQNQFIKSECKVLERLFLRSNNTLESLKLAPEDLKDIEAHLQLLLSHISYQTCIDSEERDAWSNELVNLNSKKGNAF